MSIIELIAKVVRKTHTQSIFYPLLKFVYSGNIKVDKSPMQILEEKHKRINNSCVCTTQREIAEELVDLMVVIPIYNTGRYLKSCLDSVFLQNTKYTFVIVAVNDGSTDNSAQILEKYKKREDIIIINQENKGHAGARNAALKVLRGKYITFLDSDDMLADGAIESLLDAAYSQNADMVQGGYMTFGEHRKKSEFFPINDVFHGFPCIKIYKKELWENILFPEGYWFEDTVCHFIIFPKAKNKLSIQKIIYEYRIHPQCITLASRGNPKVIDTVWVTLQLLEDRMRLGLPMDAYFYESVLLQIYNNAVRLMSLHDTEIDYANFQISREIIIKHCGGFQSKTKRFPLMVQSLRENNFRNYLLSVWLGN